MKHLILGALFNLILSSCVAQEQKKEFPTTVKTVSCEGCMTTREAAKHIGEKVKVMGSVKKVSYITWEQGEPCFINIDQAFPNVIFNVVVFKEYQTKFNDLKTLEGKKISVEGIVKMHHFEGNTMYPPTDYPQIEVQAVSQIETIF
jgi:hypothetical protein